jgi:hypothetical protein
MGADEVEPPAKMTEFLPAVAFEAAPAAGKPPSAPAAPPKGLAEVVPPAAAVEVVPPETKPYDPPVVVATEAPP